MFALNSQSQCSDLHGWHLEHLPLGSERDLSFTQTLLLMVWAWPSLLSILPIISCFHYILRSAGYLGLKVSYLGCCVPLTYKVGQ